MVKIQKSINGLPAKKHDKISDELHRRVKLGVYVEQIPTVAQLAKEFDINPLTVRKALASLEKSGTIARKERVGTFVRHKRRIAVVFLSTKKLTGKPHFNRNLFYLPMLDGIERAAEEKNYSVMPYIYDGKDKDFITALKNKNDGCILLTSETCNKSFLSNFNDFPLLRVMGIPFKDFPACQISYDNSGIGTMGAEYLAEKKCSTFVYLGHSDSVVFKQRFESFQKRVEQYGGNFANIHLDVNTMNAAARFDRARKGIEDLISKHGKDIGLYISADFFAVSVYQAIYSLNFQPVRDFPVITADNNEYFLNDITPKPTVIDIKMPKMGKKAFSLILDLINGKKEMGHAETILLKPERIHLKGKE